jgi:hypothetical protein
MPYILVVILKRSLQEKIKLLGSPNMMVAKCTYVFILVIAAIAVH